MTESTPLAVPELAIYDSREVAARQLRANVHRIRHNRYVDNAEWNRLGRDAQHALASVALALEIPGVVLSHSSAAALLGIPFICAERAHPEVTVPLRSRNTGHRVHRRRSAVAPDVMVVSHRVFGELTLTTPAQTTVDLARDHALPTGLAALDHVLRRRITTRQHLEERHHAIPPGARGRSKARLALELADPCAESPGESLSRARLFELGFPRPKLQHVVRGTDGAFIARTDFLLKPGLIGEFDGKCKYERPSPGEEVRRAGDVVWAEKQREDRIRRRGFDVARWTWPEALDPAHFRRILAEHGHHPTGQRWF